ncbi:hypothetical protein [Paenibacillus xylanexedens]|uniref:hypothetical protein n=1 Tax=Paenibacillus xylanexedens TaxID=528191 RepID=UPI001C8DFF1F|nr:hypothetical protein [Paenibacillus xylanexedens]MBY0117838.1 hypothetical protein [Paenibacillus xylanexedens]
MATSSIMKNITVESKKGSQKLISALENADKKGSIEVSFTKKHREIRGSGIKELFKGL